MTTVRDNLDTRLNEQPGSTTQGVINDGAVDPTGQFPRQEYYNSSNINYAARGSKRNELYIGGGDEGIPLDLSIPPPSEYPYNQVQETTSGHVIEIDDTAGGERILIKHRTGSGVELRHDGTVIVSSTLNRIEVSGADHTVIVEGEGNLVYKGNLNLKVDGDLNIDCLNYNVNVRGNRNENVKGSDRKTVGGNAGQIIKGGYSTTVTQQVTDTFLAGHSHNVKGTFSNNIDGAANYVSSGETVLTSEVRINMSTEDLNIAGTSTSVFGATGTFGGAGVVFYGKGATFSEGVTAPTFHGDLDGTAQFAVQADVTNSQNYADPDPGGGTGSAQGYAITNTSTPTTALPNGSNITDYLGKAAGGIRKVKIDVGNYIKNFIDKTEAYGGIADTPLTTKSARSRLKDAANRSRTTAVSSMISERVISSTALQVAPPGVGRVVSGDSTPKFGRTVFGNTSGVTPVNAFLPKKALRSVLPDPLYNPDFASNITGRLKLAPGVTLSRFFGSSGDSTSLDFIKSPEERRNIARQLYLHAEVIRSIQNNKADFANFRLVVAEGIYKPGPNETASGINDLKLKGRAVVYELFNLQGQLDLFNTFNLAEYWKDTLNYEKMILHYDTYNPDGNLHAQIILIMPQLSKDWSGNFTRTVETQFNGNVLSQGELVEVLTTGSPSPTATTGQPIPPASNNQYYTWSAGVDRRVSPALLSKLEAISRDFGQQLVITSGYRDPARNASVGGASRSQHLTGLAVDISTAGLSQQKILQLLEIASRNGITGIGVYNGSVHFDIRDGGNVAWGPDYTRNSITQVAWAAKTLQNHTNGTIV